MVGHRPEPTFAGQIGAAVAYRFANFTNWRRRMSALCPLTSLTVPIETFHSPREFSPAEKRCARVIPDGLKVMPSKVRQIVNAFFDVIAGNIRIDPGVSVGVRDGHDFWPEIPCATKRKKGPDNISPTDRGDDFDHLHNRRRGQPFTRRRIDGSPTHMGKPVVRRVDANGVDSKSGHISLHRPDKGMCALCALLLRGISRMGREGHCQPLGMYCSRLTRAPGLDVCGCGEYSGTAWT
ncbi:hypothetical protein LMG28727_06998 [Paraburkholderia kirstenboschensis]|nr:hypothetical protein LMG28727_06998 [Paraburkholderia kirstenboschensis]